MVRLLDVRGPVVLQSTLLQMSAASAVRKTLRTEQCQVSPPLTIIRNYLAREGKAMK